MTGNEEHPLVGGVRHAVDFQGGVVGQRRVVCAPGGQQVGIHWGCIRRHAGRHGSVQPASCAQQIARLDVVGKQGLGRS